VVVGSGRRRKRRKRRKRRARREKVKSCVRHPPMPLPASPPLLRIQMYQEQ
jgi:hypothetical protein